MHSERAKLQGDGIDLRVDQHGRIVHERVRPHDIFEPAAQRGPLRGQDNEREAHILRRLEGAGA